MKILMTPQQNKERINYTFKGDIIEVEYKGVLDTFDFTSLPNGIADGIISDLEINPVINAKRIDGVLEVTLLNYITNDATYAERFPTWIEV